MVRNIQAQMKNMKNILISFWRRAIVKVNSYVWGIKSTVYIHHRIVMCIQTWRNMANVLYDLKMINIDD